MDDIQATVNADEFRESVDALIEALHDVANAAEDVQESSIYINDNLSEHPTEIQADEILDFSVDISIDMDGKHD